MPIRPAASVSMLLCVLVAACASGSTQGAPDKVDELVTGIERVHVDAERAREAVSEAFERLNTLAAGRFDKDPAAVVYARFVQATDVASEEAKRFRESVEPVLRDGKQVFEQRQQAIASIELERLRQRSQLRFAVDQERYDALCKAAAPAREQFDAFVSVLRDHAKFLAFDLNASAIDDIQDEVKALARTALELDHNLETTMAAARAYAEQSALPSAGPQR